MERINVAHVLPRSAANGPGERFVVWVQGCPLRCPGCWNPDTWDPTPRRLESPASLLALVDATPGLDGVTLTGGEPFAQARALLPFARGVAQRGHSLFAFTGYDLGELESPDQRALLGLVDVLVAGRYVAAERSTELPWRGSRNQIIHRLSPRGLALAFPDEACWEVVLSAAGEGVVTGFPPRVPASGCGHGWEGLAPR